MTSALPFRPRLAEGAMLRRHLIDGVEKLVLHDTMRAEVVELSAEQLGVLLACDGTRDLGGVVLAAVRSGSYRRISEVEQLLGELMKRGLLADGIEARADATPSNRPLEVLGNFTLTCNRSGGCCALYSSVAFLDDDVRHARSACPEVLEGGAAGRDFLPLHGSVPNGSFATTMVDGACALLDADGGCRVHARAGAEHKPLGCRIFPTTFMDDGEAVRVSVAVECACVLASVGKTGGEPLVRPGALGALDLPRGVRVPRLDASLRISADHVADARTLRGWVDRVLAEQGDGDPVAVAWALATSCDRHGLDEERAVAAMRDAVVPSATTWRGRIEALATVTAARLESANAWRSERDRARRLAAWIDAAAQSLRQIASLQQVLALEGGRAAVADEERFYLTSSLWGHRLLGGSLTLAQALRDRATRMLLARRMGLEVAPCCRDDPSRDYPLAAVEAMMRGQGLESYAFELP